MNDNSTIDNNHTPENEEPTGGLGLAWTIIIAIVVVGAVAFMISIFFREEPGTPQTATVDEAQSNAEEVSPQQEGALQQESSLELEGLSAEELFEQGNNFVQAGQFQKAVAAYQQAIELDPEYQAVYANLGVVYYQLEQLDLAAQQYEKALELDPNDGEVTYNLAALNLQRALSSGTQPDQALLDQAITLLQKAMELSPDLAEPPLYFRGGLYGLAKQR